MDSWRSAGLLGGLAILALFLIVSGLEGTFGELVAVVFTPDTLIIRSDAKA